jgi:hypothetical protein
LFDYVKQLVEALEAELQAKLFTIDMLGPEVFTYLDTNGVKLDEIARALRNYEVDPKPSASRSMDIYESFVHLIAGQNGVDVSKPKGLSEWVESLKSKKLIASNLLLLHHGLIGIRNMTHHNPDSETGKAWNITKQAALVSTLVVPIIMRTTYLYIMKKEQEF